MSRLHQNEWGEWEPRETITVDDSGDCDKPTLYLVDGKRVLAIEQKQAAGFTGLRRAVISACQDPYKRHP